MARQKTDADLEADYQAKLIRKLRRLFPGCIIEKFDIRQGYPDLIILWRGMWAALEVKAAWNSPERPNQREYIKAWSQQTFASFIYPENELEVLDGLQRSFSSARAACLSES